MVVKAALDRHCHQCMQHSWNMCATSWYTIFYGEKMVYHDFYNNTLTYPAAHSHVSVKMLVTSLSLWSKRYTWYVPGFIDGVQETRTWQYSACMVLTRSIRHPQVRAQKLLAPQNSPYYMPSKCKAFPYIQYTILSSLSICVSGDLETVLTSGD